MKHAMTIILILLTLCTGLGRAEDQIFHATRLIRFPSLEVNDQEEKIIRRSFLSLALPLPGSQWLVMNHVTETELSKPWFQHEEGERFKFIRNDTRSNLVLFDHNGKILAQSKINIPISAFTILNSNISFTMPLVEDCMYGFLEIDLGKVFCFNYELQLIQELEVPLDWSSSIVAMETEQGPELWVFGGRSKKNKTHRFEKGTS